jgi:hypothetical protein
LHVTDTPESFESLLTAALPAEHTTPAVKPEAEIDDDDHLHDDLHLQYVF